MDRREALKKMAVGGATIAGASTVMTAVAFAYSTPFNVVKPSVVFIGQIPSTEHSGYTANSKITVRVNPGQAQCPGSCVVQPDCKSASGATLTTFTAQVTASTLVDPYPSSGPTTFQLHDIIFSPSFAYGPLLVNGQNAVIETHGIYKSFYAVKTYISSGSTTHNDNSKFTAGDSLTIKVTIVWTCNYAKGSKSTTSKSYTGTFVRQAGEDVSWSPLTPNLA